MNMNDMVEKIANIAPKDPAFDSLGDMLLYSTEELGEIAACVATEKGLKNKKLKEPAYIECVDLIIASLGMYFACGGKKGDLADLIDFKSDKWKKRVCVE